MASLQELRKRLRSVRSTVQLAEAMRTAAQAKYARLSRARDDFGPYADACRNMRRLLGGTGIVRETTEIARRDCLVVFSGNRGLCGGFNAELLRFLDGQLRERNETLLLVCGGKAAAALREQGAAFEEFPLSDVPDPREIKALAERLRALYMTGEAERVLAVYQSFQNMLIQTPALRQILPEAAETEGSAEELAVLYLPDRETIGAQLAVSCLDAEVFDLALESAAGAQAATLMAMRSACDNAEATADELEITINRRRQAEVTSEVIEIASGNTQQGD